jgi:hypothetical protein
MRDICPEYFWTRQYIFIFYQKQCHTTSGESSRDERTKDINICIRNISEENKLEKTTKFWIVKIHGNVDNAKYIILIQLTISFMEIETMVDNGFLPSLLSRKEFEKVWVILIALEFIMRYMKSMYQKADEFFAPSQ